MFLRQKQVSSTYPLIFLLVLLVLSDCRPSPEEEAEVTNAAPTSTKAPTEPSTKRPREPSETKPPRAPADSAVTKPPRAPAEEVTEPVPVAKGPIFAFDQWEGGGEYNGTGYIGFVESTGTDLTGTRFGVGVVKHVRGSALGQPFSNTILTAGIEIDKGFMTRLSLVDVTFHAGDLDLRVGLQFDIGFSFGGYAIEWKLLGIGYKVGLSEVQYCLIICYGVRYRI